MKNSSNRRDILRKLGLPLILALGAAAPTMQAHAQQNPKEVKVGLLVPLSGLYARPGQVMRMGAEMAIDHINAQGGVKSLGGAKLKLVVLDSGDTTEKAKNAAQRMVAQEPDMVAASGAYLSSFTLSATEVTERAKLPLLTLSYSDLITSRGFNYVFQTSATAAAQAEMSLPVMIKLAESNGPRPKTVAIITDNTGASVASVKPMRERLLKELGGYPYRGASFIRAIALADPRGVTVAESDGICRGLVLHAPQGHGAGYDPIFYVREAAASYAQLNAHQKSRFGSRGRAARALAPLL